MLLLFFFSYNILIFYRNSLCSSKKKRVAYFRVIKKGSLLTYTLLGSVLYYPFIILLPCAYLYAGADGGNGGAWSRVIK